jgi:Ca-activated chloride channel family protein
MKNLKKSSLIVLLTMSVLIQSCSSTNRKVAEQSVRDGDEVVEQRVKVKEPGKNHINLPSTTLAKPLSPIAKGDIQSAGYAGKDNMVLAERGAVLNDEEKEIDKREGLKQTEDYNTEQYNRIYENPFLEVTKNPLSTFSIDVDTASYSNIRRFLSNNTLPPKDAVRVEEMLNYFTYDYPQPKGNDPFSINIEMSDSPWKKDHKLVHIGLQGKEIPTKNMPSSNLVFLLDTSGSMESPDKLPLLKSAFKLLLSQLRENDRVSIVVYAGSAGLVLPSTPGNQKEKIEAALDNLQAGGSTAGGEGIQLAYKIAMENFIENGNNRVILATDGDFNVGASSDGELIRMIEEKREQGTFLSILGFGTGNYKDSKMEQLADKGNGNYAYIDGLNEAKKVFVKEMGGTLLTIAKDVKLQVEFNPSKVKAYRLIGYENRMLRNEDFNDDKKDAGDIGSGHRVTAMYEIIPAGVNATIPEVDKLKYQETKISDSSMNSKEIMTVKFRYKDPKSTTSKLIVKSIEDKHIKTEDTSDDFRFSAAVAGLGLLMRDSEFKGSITAEDIVDMAKNAKGEDTEGYRKEFIKLAQVYQSLQNNKDQ